MRVPHLRCLQALVELSCSGNGCHAMYGNGNGNWQWLAMPVTMVPVMATGNASGNWLPVTDSARSCDSEKYI